MSWSNAQLHALHDQIKSGLDEGATLLSDGETGECYFVEPTLLANTHRKIQGGARRDF